MKRVNYMRIKFSFISIFLGVLFLFSACPNPFNALKATQDKNTDGLASLRVSLASAGNARSIMPKFEDLQGQVVKWELELFQDENPKGKSSDFEIGKLSISGIEPGEYTIVLSGYDKDQTNNNDVLVLQGQVEQTLKPGPNTVEMSLAPPRTPTGTGTLYVGFNFSESGLENLDLADFEISMTNSKSDKKVEFGEGVIGYNADSKTLTISGSFPSGDYFLSVSLKIDEVEYSILSDPIVKIYDGQTSSKTFTMDEATLQTIQNTRYVSKDGVNNGTGLNPMSSWAWSEAIAWANENTTGLTRTLVLVENIELDTVVEVKAPMALRSIGSYSLTLTKNLQTTGFIQVRAGHDRVEDTTYYGSLALEDITITAKANVSAIYGLVDVQSIDTSTVAKLVIGNGAVLKGHASRDFAWAGGIYAHKAEVVLASGSTITGNTAESGGAVSAMNGSTLVVEEGATISGNTADYGGAFYVDNSSKIVLKQGAKIATNTARYGSGLCIEPSIGEGDPEVYSSEVMNAETIDFETAQKLFTPGADDPFALCLYYSGTSQDVLGEALTDDSGWPGLVRVNSTITYESTLGTTPSSIAVKGTKAIIGGAEYSISNSADTLFSVGNAQLYLDDITITGYENAETSLIMLETNGKLVMRDDSKITGHKVYGGDGGGGGVYVANGGTFTMDGGTIEGCFAYRGAGVYVANGGTLNLNGGTIEQNVSSLDYGAGLYAESGASIALGGDKSIGEFVKNNTVHDPQDEFPWQQAFIDAVINYEFDSGDSPEFTDLQQAVEKANSSDVPVRFWMSNPAAPPSITMTRTLNLTGNLWLVENISLYRAIDYKNAFFELTDSASLVLGFVTLSGKSGDNSGPVSDVKEALVVAKGAASVVLVNATLEYNTGGGLRLENTATLYVAGNGSINENSAEQGAGIYLADKSSIVLELEEFDGLIVFANTATLEGDYGYGGIYAEDSMGDWVEAIYPYLTDSVNQNEPKQHNLVASIPTATFSEQIIGDDSVYVLLSNEDPETEEYIWKLNMPEELRTYRIPIVDNTSGYPPRDLAVYDGEGNEVPSMTLVDTDDYRTTEIIFSYSGGGTIYLKDKNCIAFGITYADPNYINFDNLEELRSYGSSYPTSFVVAEKDGNYEKPVLSPSFYFGQTSSEITSYSKTFSVYNLSGAPISINGVFKNASSPGNDVNNGFSYENFPMAVPKCEKEDFNVIFKGEESGEYKVDFTLSANGEEFVLEFSGFHSN